MRKPSAFAIAALEAAARGWFVLPLRPRRKEPLRGSAGFKEATSDVARIRTMWESVPNANIGLAPGPSGLLVLDLDGPVGTENARLLGLLDVCTLTVVTGRLDGGKHLYFKHPGGVIGNRPLCAKIDVRADAGYVVIPPSIHPSSGKAYSFVDPATAIADLPPNLVASLRSGTDPLLHDTAEPAHSGPLGVIDRGSRNTTLASFAGFLRSRGLDREAINATLQVINEHQCDPPLSTREVTAIAKSVSRYEPTGGQRVAAFPDVAALMENWNARFAVAPIAGKVFVVEELQRGFEFYTPANFTLLYRPHFVWVGDTKPRLKNATEVWLSSGARRQYARVAFEPGAPSTTELLNLWRGFAIEPIEGDCSLFLAHVRDNICSGNAELFEWVMAWFADLFQRPTEKPGTALVLRGKQGVGKTVVGRAIGGLLEPHYRVVSDARHVTGHFNRHLESTLLLQAEEAFWAGDKAAEGTLKHLVTSDKLMIERKGVDSYEANNFTRVLVTSNADWVVPAGLEERRFAVLDVGEAHIQDHRYFGAIDAQLKAGGSEALLFTLLRWKYDPSILRRPPRTEALDQQKIASLSAEQGWLLDCFERGSLPGDTTGRGESPSELLRADYLRHANDTGRSRKQIDTGLGIFLRRTLPSIRKRTGTYTVKGIERVGKIWQFPPLRECRRLFHQALGLSGTSDAIENVDWRAEPDYDDL